MELLPDVSLHVKLKSWSRYLAAMVMVLAVLVLSGWQFDIEFFKRLFPWSTAMNPVTAVCFLFSAISFLLISKEKATKYKSTTAIILVSVVFMAGVIKMIDLFIDIGWHIDRILFANKVNQDIIDNMPNSMAPNTAFCFILIGIALWLQYIKTPGKYMSIQVIVLIIGLIGWLSVLGYLYKVDSFYSMLHFIPMSLYTAICFLCISLAILFDKPDKGIMKQLTSTFGGSVTARLLLPAAVIIPSVLGFLRLYGDWAGIYTTEFGVAVYTLSFIIIFLGLIWYSALVLNKRDMLKKETEDALRDSEEQISAIFKAAPDAVIVIDSYGRIIRWNPEAQKLFYWTALEITGKLLSETIIPSQYREAHNKGIQKFLETGETRILGKTIEIQAMKKDNTQIDVALRVAPVVIKDNNMFVGFIRDITERKQIEQRLKNFNEELTRQVDEKTKEITQIFERLSDAFITVDKNFYFTYLNKKAGEMIHRNPELMIGKNMWAEFPDAVGSSTYNAFHKALAEQQNVSNTDYYEPLDLWHENNIYPSPDGLSIFTRDISKKMNAEIALKEKEEKFRTFVEEAVDGILVFSPKERRYVEANRKASELLGYSIEELLLIKPDDLQFPDDRVPTPYDKLEAGESVRIERSMRRKDGSAIRVETSARRLPDGNYLAFVRDITQRKEAEREMVRLNEELRKLTNYLQEVREEERTHIAREIHDELGQQLTVLKMDVAWVNKKIDDGNTPIKEKINEILSMIDNTVRTVRRISSELRPSLLDDLGLMPALEWHLEEFEKRSGIKKQFTAPKDDIHLSDEIKIGLFRIFQESLTNVARHSEAGNVNVSIEQNNKKVILTITDDGQGFDEEKPTKKTLGILGMKERTLMLGGEYSITAIPGKGTTVRVVIPLKNSR